MLMWADQVKAKARWAEATVTSGDDGEPFEGRRVGVSSLGIISGLSSIASASFYPIWDPTGKIPSPHDGP
jgi:hypothetical protein